MNVPRVDGLRQIRRALLISYFLIALLYGVAVGAFFTNQARIDDINESRLENTIVACREQSESNQAILAYLEALGARPESLVQARRFFPVLSDRECAVQATRRVKPSP